jgi:hypothetical protein
MKNALEQLLPLLQPLRRNKKMNFLFRQMERENKEADTKSPLDKQEPKSNG